MPMTRSLCVLAAAAALSGCAAMNSLSSDVSSHGQWPAERRASMSFVFERLPSQQEQPDRQALLEDAARPALEAAGFRPAADPAAADYSVELGARVSGDDRVYLSEGFGPGAGMASTGGPASASARARAWAVLGQRWATPVYEREVLVLIRDRRSGRTVYETRASNQGSSSAINALLPAMFAAALKDFPSAGMNPRRVVTQIDKR